MEESNSLVLLERWRNGDDSAANPLFQRYFEKLVAQAQRKISRRLARRVDAEEVVMSAYGSFFKRARNPGELLQRRGDVWGLLLCITLRKVAGKARWHLRQKRGLDREQDVRFDDESLIGLLEGAEPDPAVAAEFEDELEQLIAKQEERDRLVVERLLAGDDAKSIAKVLKVSDRTVRRVLKRVKDGLKERLEIEGVLEQ